MNDVGTNLELYSNYRSFSGEFRYTNNMQLKSNEDFPVLQLSFAIIVIPNKQTIRALTPMRLRNILTTK